MTAANLGNTVQADVEVYAASNGRAVQVWTHFQKKNFLNLETIVIRIGFNISKAPFALDDSDNDFLSRQ